MTAILCAIETELEPYLAVTSGTASVVSGLIVHEGTMDGAPVILVCCGVGKVNAALAVQMLIDRFPIQRIILSGTAGGIDKRLKIGDTVVSADIAYHDVSPCFLTEYPPHLPGAFFRADESLLESARVLQSPTGQPVYFGRIVTGDSFIDTNGRAEIIKRLNPLCVDMETAAAAHVCTVNRIPFLAVRSVSDTEDDHGLGSFLKNAAMASKHSFLLVRELLKEVTKHGSLL